jgi:hypothetical protein
LTILEVARIYAGSNGEETKQLYARLEPLGPAGVIAMNLFRAQKASSRAKVYRGGIRGRGSFRSMAYEKKNWSLQQLCQSLSGSELVFGWKRDPAAAFHEWVLYVELPNGQVSFHSATALTEHRYQGDWDGMHLSAERIIHFVSHVLSSREGAAVR